MFSLYRLRIAVRMLPTAVALAIMPAVLAGIGAGCGKGIFQEVTSSGSPTATSTSGAGGAFLYASNTNDGKIVEFKRNLTTGALTTIATTTAGNKGVQGLTITSDNRFLYAADSGSNKVYEFRVNSNGSLARIGNGSIAAGTQPVMIAVDPTVSWAFAANQGTGTSGTGSISEYSINSSNGTLTANGTITNYKGTAFGFPFGILVHPLGGFVYVSDNHAGVIYVFSITANGTLAPLQVIPSFGTSNGNPGLMVITSDSGGGTYLFVPDTANGQISEFTIGSAGTLTFGASTGPGSNTMPIGIAAANKAASANNYLFTANKVGNYAQWFLRSASTLTPGSPAVANLHAPVGAVAVVNASGSFVYVGESGSGSVAELQINGPGACGTLCFVNRFNTESGAGIVTQYLALTN